MNKTELIKSVSKSTKVDEATVRIVFNGIIDTIKESLWIGINVIIKDFISFKLEIREEAKKRNFKTNEALIVPKHFRVKVELPKVFKDKMKTKNIY